jgi:hypothetical protein
MLKTILSNWLIPAIVLILVLFIAYFFASGLAVIIAGMIFFFILAMGIFSVVKNHVKLYREKRISRTALARNIFVEVTGILLMMILAAALGRYVTEMAMNQIGHTLLGFAAAIAFGLLAGMGLGFLVKQTWSRAAKI